LLSSSTSPAEKEALLDTLQSRAFDYFVVHVNSDNGLVQDTSQHDSPCSIAVVGFALSCYPIAVERGWMRREHAAELTLTTLRFFMESHQGPELDATGHMGFYYHFLEMKSGRRTWACELSMIDSALLLAGALTAAAYFDQEQSLEREIRGLVDRFYQRMDWRWSVDQELAVSHGWMPESGFFRYDWQGYSEAAILYVLALGSPSLGLGTESYKSWTLNYQWERIYGFPFLYAGPLFIHLYSHAWIDFRGIQDRSMAYWKSDYFKNTQHAIRIQREFAYLNPNGFVGYGPDLWGFTACNGPHGEVENLFGDIERCRGYAARGVPFGPDDGTIAPWAPLACLPFDPDAAMSALGHIRKTFPQLLREGRFPSSFNPTLQGEGPEGWVSPGCSGLDQGLLVMMIENSRTELIWRLMRSCQPIRRGLERANFGKGWLA
jgi:hypothetical protein